PAPVAPAPVAVPTLTPVITPEPVPVETPAPKTDAEYEAKWNEIRRQGQAECLKFREIFKEFVPDSKQVKSQKKLVNSALKEGLQLLDKWHEDRTADRDALLQEGYRATSTKVVAVDAIIAQIDNIRSGYTYAEPPKKIDDVETFFDCFYSRLDKEPGERMTKTVDGIEYRFRWCPPGDFMMGSPESETDRSSDETQHRVTLTRGFWMLETEVTVGMFKSFVNATGYESKGNTPFGWTRSIWNQDSKYSWRSPGFSQTDSHPVTCVSWADAQAFCKWLTGKVGITISLPSEAQWEYACRAGTTGKYAGNLDSMAWYYGNSSNRPHPVGTKQANAWGLYDMHGNVWEWCQDWYGNYPTNSVTDPTGPTSGSDRVYRGGSWDSYAEGCRSAYRSDYSPEYRNSSLGFRVCSEQ
ncbi:MAG: formylglycine-generating enzyme family protein, partial [Planctomycetia bacterium]|nr:formylglycine-generating enzyme family protein [Planctomycetia bacterium]